MTATAVNVDPPAEPAFAKGQRVRVKREQLALFRGAVGHLAGGAEVVGCFAKNPNLIDVVFDGRGEPERWHFSLLEPEPAAVPGTHHDASDADGALTPRGAE